MVLTESTSPAPHTAVQDGQTPLETAYALAQKLAEQEVQADGRESTWAHAVGMLQILQPLQVDEPTQVAALLFGLNDALPLEAIQKRFGVEVHTLVAGMRELLRLKDLTARTREGSTGAELETLRRMTLAMASDIRVVVLRLASRLQSLRDAAARRRPPQPAMCHETLEVLAPLANRLGLGSLKWELEDLAFRFLEPEIYQGIAQQLEERRAEREAFVAAAVQRLQSLLRQVGVAAEVSGRPKHIHSIWHKMRSKDLRFEQIQDLRAFRVIVHDVKACYTVLDIVHQCWPPILSEFDDYISRPKSNGYRSLHTVVTGDDGRPLEIQIRTHAMHQHAEFGVAAHWRYKEASTRLPGGARATAAASAGAQPGQDWSDQVSWLRQLLYWQQELGASLGATGASKSSAADAVERIYLLTPQARVIELPQGATPIDFAYHVHTALGHRCRGARVDGQLVPLQTPLRNGQTVEIVPARSGASAAPSRDWLNPTLGFVRSERARAKVRQWFKAQEHDHAVAEGRERLEKMLQREGRTALGFDELARRLGYSHAEQLFIALAREQVGPRQIEDAIHAPDTASAKPAQAAAAHGHTDLPHGLTRHASRAPHDTRPDHAVLVVGVDALMNHLARCCRPLPPDDIVGFVTRGRGISIHRQGCPSMARLSEQMPERILPASWSPESLAPPVSGSASPHRYPADISAHAHDRPGLLRDISDILARDRLNVVAVNTRTRDGLAHMDFTIEVAHLSQLHRAITGILQVTGVIHCQRRL